MLLSNVQLCENVQVHNILILNFIAMSSQERFRKNQSMNSTHYMSCNQSYATNFHTENRPNSSVLMNYSHIPMPKESPQWNQSVATWRNTSQKYSFSKDSRFKDNRPYYSDIIEPEIPSTISSKSCSFGSGQRRPISNVVLRNAKQKPAPDRYDFTGVNEQTRRTSRGKSFGIGWKHYERTYIKHRPDIYAEFQTEDNPPAQYQVREVPGRNKKKFSMYGRLKMYSQKMAEDKNWVPGPYHVVKDRHLYAMVGMNDRNFSFGQRIDLSKPANENPQAIYQVQGFCDKFTNLKSKKERTSVSTR